MWSGNDFLSDGKKPSKENLNSWLLPVGSPGEELCSTGLGDNT